MNGHLLDDEQRISFAHSFDVANANNGVVDLSNGFGFNVHYNVPASVRDSNAPYTADAEDAPHHLILASRLNGNKDVSSAHVRRAINPLFRRVATLIIDA